MPTTDRSRGDDRLRFSPAELSGSLGDLGTFLPLALALCLSCGMDIGLVFIFAGLMNVATGLWFRQPIPVQPMKAIAAVAIADGLSPGSIAAAGLFVGAVVIALALVGVVDWVARVVPTPVVRGIQAGVGVKLLLGGLGWIADLPALGWDSWLVAALVALALLGAAGRRIPVLLLVFAAGFVLQWFEGATPGHAWTPGGPGRPEILATDWSTGILVAGVAQVPLTLLNSVIAVCALSADYFPGRGIKPRRMAISVGLMNLACVPFGGMPMCHGAGGLAAQHRFGARTGGSVVMLGAMKIAAGLLFGSVLLSALSEYPKSILGVMVVFAGLALAGTARDSLAPPRVLIVLGTAGAILLWGTLIGFLVGCAIALLVAAARRHRSNTP